MKKNVTWSDISKHPHVSDFRNLGKLLTKKGKLPNSIITGEQLRSILDEKVKDGPTLRIMNLKEWAKGLNEMLNFAKSYKYTDNK